MNENMDISIYREKYLSNKTISNSVLVIGNGTSCMDNMDGMIIQGFDEVYRFNFYETDGYKGYVGTRTTHWCITDKIVDDPSNYLNNSNLVRILCFIPKIKQPHVNSSLSDNNMFMMIPDWVENNIKDNYYSDRNIYWASTGLMVIYYILKSTNKSIYVKGFDSFTIKNGNYHYYGKEDRVTSDHDSDLEREVLKKMIDTGRVHLL